MTAVLELDGVGRRYGQLDAVAEVTLTVDRGSRHALIGPNGAGKSTLFGLISGTVRPTSGRIHFEGADITRRPPHRRTQIGMGRTFQHSSLFDGMSRARTSRSRRSGSSATRAGPAAGAPLPRRRGASQELLELVGLGRPRRRAGRSLSYGHRRPLEIALALAPSRSCCCSTSRQRGCRATRRGRFIGLIGGLPPERTIMIVEHDMDVVFGLATHVAVLDAGPADRERAAGGDPVLERRAGGLPRPRRPDGAALHLMTALLEIRGVRAGYDTGDVSRTSTSTVTRARSWRCSAATASARRR